MENEQELEKQCFLEEFGVLFEQHGLPRMTGRILGWLLISDPPHQSTDEMAEALSASKGSISTTTRLLIRIGQIERFSFPGVRHDYFRVKPGACYQMLKDSLVHITTMRQLAERGLELLEGKANRGRLEEMRDMYALFEREYPALLERWEQEHRKGELPVR